MPQHIVKPEDVERQQRRTKFRDGMAQFNSGRFFDAHETWEEIWLAECGSEKAFFQGIIQIAAAFHHYKRGNLRGARSLMEAGLRRLAPFPAQHGGIALEPLRASAQEWIFALGEGRDLGAASIPRIESSE